MKKVVQYLSALTIPFLGASCGNSNLLFTTGTLFGLEAEISPDQTQALKLGYQRIEGVKMPTKIKDPDTGKPVLIPKAFSTLSLFDMRTGEFTKEGFGYIKIKQVFATGKAATQPSAGEAVGNTMLNLKEVPVIGPMALGAANQREAIVEGLEDDEFSDTTLKAIIEVLGLNPETKISAAERALDTATDTQIDAIYKKAFN